VQQVVLPDCPPPHFALRIDGGAVIAARRLCRQTLVRPHGAVGADDSIFPGTAPRFRRARCSPACGSPARAAAMFRRRLTKLVGVSSFINNPVTSDPVRYAAMPRS